MGYRANLTATRFIDIATGKESLGVRIYDDAAQAYDNTWEEIPDDDLEILRQVLANAGDVEGDILEFIRENQRGIYINDSWYDWDKIKSVFTQAFEDEGPHDEEAVEDKDRRRGVYGPEYAGEQF